MPVHNAKITAVFTENADLLDLESANPFRIRANRNATRTIESLSVDLAGIPDRPPAAGAVNTILDLSRVSIRI